MRATQKVQVAIASLIAVAFVSLVGLPAGAQDAEAEYSDVINTTLSRSTVQACGNEGVTATSTGLLPGSDVSFTFFSDPVDLGTVQANDEGVASITFDIPPGTPLGNHLVVTEGTNSFGAADRHEITIVITACGTTPTTPGGGGGGGNGGGSGGGTGPGDLARTGSDLSNPLRIAVVLFAAGAALILATRKRQARTA